MSDSQITVALYWHDVQAVVMSQICESEPSVQIWISTAGGVYEKQLFPSWAIAGTIISHVALWLYHMSSKFGHVICLRVTFACKRRAGKDLRDLQIYRVFIADLD
jgi:hypothetical protein